MFEAQIKRTLIDYYLKPDIFISQRRGNILSIGSHFEWLKSQVFDDSVEQRREELN